MNWPATATATCAPPTRAAPSFATTSRATKALLEDIGSQAVPGYRAPSFSIGPANLCMLASRSFRETLDVLEPLADYVVLAAADIDATADAQLTARQAHGIVVAVTDPGTRPRQLDQVFARLETGRAPVLGAVLVEAGAPILTKP